MGRLAASLVLSLVLAGMPAAAKGPSAARRISFARLESPTLGIAAAFDVVTCGRDCTSYKPHVFIKEEGHAWRDVTPPRMLFQFEDARFLDDAPRLGGRQRLRSGQGIRSPHDRRRANLACGSRAADELCRRITSGPCTLQQETRLVARRLREWQPSVSVLTDA